MWACIRRDQNTCKRYFTDVGFAASMSKCYLRPCSQVITMYTCFEGHHNVHVFHELLQLHVFNDPSRCTHVS